jgi:hypothetical protein
MISGIAFINKGKSFVPKIENLKAQLGSNKYQ